MLNTRTADALSNISADLLTEDPATVNHAARLRLGRNIMTNPDAVAEYVVRAVIGAATVEASGDAVSDSDLSAAVLNLINVFAV